MKGEETGVVDQVSVVGHPRDKALKQANIKLRFNRNPQIGEGERGWGVGLLGLGSSRW
jgi:hypothetical protein